jgi:hypothetical protein
MEGRFRSGAARHRGPKAPYPANATMKNHHWTESDDCAALYLYRFGRGLPQSAFTKAARARGMSESSLRMRVGNFKAIETGTGLGN